MTSEPRERPVTRLAIDLRGWRPGAFARSRPPVAVGLGVMAIMVVAGLAVVAGALVVQAVSPALFSGGGGQIRSGSAVATAGRQSLELQSRLVERQRAAVAAYAAQLTEFKGATARPPGAVGINLGAAETRRREGVLTGLVLDCINAVDRYNLAAQGVEAAQLRSAGLPERFAWAVDCASGQ